MNIKSKLSIQFALLVLSILLFFSLMVYYFSYTCQRAKFRENHISGLVTDLRKMNQLINGMLELAHLNRNNNTLFSDLRIDEPVINAIQSV
jgi:hypothetical protein